jgi:lipid II:glycine glycyltransferase (peptidoglycan interpeptide bridge formation enzyme)
MELQQSLLYQAYIKALHWNVVTIDGAAVFYRKIPFIGTLAKLQRPAHLPYLPKFIMELKKLGIRQISVEPRETTSQEVFSSYLYSLSKFFRILKTPFIPTKTIIIDLTLSEHDIFSRFTSAKRRAVRRAEKNDLRVVESHNINDLISIKSKAAGLFGGITTHGIDRLWKLVYPQYATILLAQIDHKKTIAGILLLFWNKTTYYWVAGATRKGKKLFAPTLLVWHALKVGKKKKCTQFDFIGVWDERKPHQFPEWKGFTKFKEGFGGKPLYYPITDPGALS